VADGLAAGFHLAGSGDEDHAGIDLVGEQMLKQLDALAVRQVVIQQDQARLESGDQLAGLGERGGDAHGAKAGVLADEIGVQLGLPEFVFDDQHVICLHGLHLWE
jgi:hypothetical protein